MAARHGGGGHRAAQGGPRRGRGAHERAAEWFATAGEAGRAGRGRGGSGRGGAGSEGLGARADTAQERRHFDLAVRPVSDAIGIGGGGGAVREGAGSARGGGPAGRGS